MLSQESLRPEQVNRGIREGLLGFLGELGYGRAGVQLLDTASTHGVLRMSRQCVDDVKSGLLTITSLDGVRSAVKSVRVSGMLHKVKRK